MKNLFKYDFLNQNKGIQSAIMGVLCCIFIATSKYNTSFIIILSVIWVIVSFGLFYIFNHWFIKQNFGNHQLDIFNKIGWLIYVVSFVMTFYVIFWLS